MKTSNSIFMLQPELLCSVVSKWDKNCPISTASLSVLVYCVQMGRLHSSGTPIFSTEGAILNDKFVS